MSASIVTPSTGRSSSNWVPSNVSCSRCFVARSSNVGAGNFAVCPGSTCCSLYSKAYWATCGTNVAIAADTGREPGPCEPCAS